MEAKRLSTTRAISLVTAVAMVLMTVPGAPVATAGHDESCDPGFHDRGVQHFRTRGWVQVSRVTPSSVSSQVVLNLYDEGPLDDQPGRDTLNGIDAYVTCVPDDTNVARSHEICLKRLQPEPLDALGGRIVDLLAGGVDTQPDLKVELFDDDGDHMATVDPDVPRLDVVAGEESTACSDLVEIPEPRGEEVEWVAVVAEGGTPQGVQHRLNAPGEPTNGKGVFTEHFELHVCASPDCPT